MRGRGGIMSGGPIKTLIEVGGLLGAAGIGANALSKHEANKTQQMQAEQQQQQYHQKPQYQQQQQQQQQAPPQYSQRAITDGGVYQHQAYCNGQCGQQCNGQSYQHKSYCNGQCGQQCNGQQRSEQQSNGQSHDETEFLFKN